MSHHHIWAWTLNCRNLDKLEAFVDTLTVHPDTITTGNGMTTGTYFGGHTLLYIMALRMQEMGARIAPPKSRPVALRIIEKLLKKGADPNKYRVPNTGSGTYGLVYSSYVRGCI